MNAKIQMVENYKEFLANNQGDEIDLRDFYFKSGSDGFVKVIDVYGTEQRIIDAARISYGKGTVRKSEDTILLRYLMRHRHCYKADMEVLTIDGWKQWRNYLIMHRTRPCNMEAYAKAQMEYGDKMREIGDYPDDDPWEWARPI